MYALWNASGDAWESMMVSYEVAFDEGFDWVKGGKLPGLRGGSANGCSGGSQADGSDCFSTRIMWRTDGEGEGAFPCLTCPEQNADAAGSGGGEFTPQYTPIYPNRTVFVRMRMLRAMTSLVQVLAGACSVSLVDSEYLESFSRSTLNAHCTSPPDGTASPYSYG